MLRLKENNPSNGESITAHGRLEQFSPRHQEHLTNIRTIDLLHEIGFRLTNKQEFPSSEEALSISRQEKIIFRQMWWTVR